MGQEAGGFHRRRRFEARRVDTCLARLVCASKMGELLIYSLLNVPMTRTTHSRYPRLLE